MTFQRKLLLGFSLMVLPALLVGAEAIRSNLLERRALQALGQSMARTRTYAELETAMFDQSEIIWRYLTGMDPTARKEFRLAGQVVDYWQQRWAAELRPEEMGLADGVRGIQQQIQAAAASIFGLYDSGQNQAAFTMAQQELKGRLQPALTQLNRDIYRRARESSVRGAYARLEEVLAAQERMLVLIVVLTLGAGLLGSWLISRSLARPVSQLTGAMAVVGAGNLEHPITTSSRDEIGELARAFAGMTDNLRQSRSDMVRLNTELEAKISQLERTQAQLVQSEKLASIGEMAAAVAHGLRNPLASLRAAAQVVRRHPESPSSSEHLDAIVEEVDRLDRRISHLLSFSRPAPSGRRARAFPGWWRVAAGVLRAAAGARSEAGSRDPAHTARSAGRPHAGRAGPGGAGLQRARRHAVRWPAAHRCRVERRRDRQRGRHRNLRYRPRHTGQRPPVGLRAVLHHAHRWHRTRPRDRQALRRAERRPARDHQPARRDQRAGAAAGRGPAAVGASS